MKRFSEPLLLGGASNCVVQRTAGLLFSLLQTPNLPLFDLDCSGKRNHPWRAGCWLSAARVLFVVENMHVPHACITVGFTPHALHGLHVQWCPALCVFFEVTEHGFPPAAVARRHASPRLLWNVEGQLLVNFLSIRECF